MVIIAIFVSILAGLSVVIGRVFNAKMAEKMGLFQGASINYLAGLLTSILLTIIFHEWIVLKAFTGLPIYAYLGGLLGIFIVVLSSYLTKKLSAFYLTLLIFIGQLITGLILDYFISNQLSLSKILGGSLVLAGFIYNLLLDQKKDQNLQKAA